MFRSTDASAIEPTQPDYFSPALILLHWGMALLFYLLFPLGWMMVGLDYYDPLYQSLPWWHKSFGLLFGFLLLSRIGVILVWPSPAPLPSLNLFERVAAKTVHYLLYLGMVGLMITGYLIPTAEGEGIDCFGWFEFPALPWQFEEQADIAGAWHRWIAWGSVGLSLLHAMAALKHHFIDRDRTLLRMLRR